MPTFRRQAPGPHAALALVPALLVLGVGCVLSSDPLDGRPPAVAVAAGTSHTCALDAVGDVWCWGNGTRGRLGPTDRIPRGEFDVPIAASPIKVAISGIALIAAGSVNTCVVRASDRALLCWGDNFCQQLGPTDSASVTSPVEPFPGRAIRHVSVRYCVTCIVTEAGVVECLGADESYAVRGARALSDPPYPPRFRSVSVGLRVYCAVSEEGQAFCWGNNAQVQFRPDSAVELITRPILMADSVSSIAMGYGYMCAVMLVGGIRCWGGWFAEDALEDVSSQIGTVRAMAAGTVDAWLLNEAGDVWRWESPVAGSGPINTEFRALTLVAGFGHGCALGTDEGVWCWGTNGEGELGIGTQSAAVREPVRVFP